LRLINLRPIFENDYYAEHHKDRKKNRFSETLYRNLHPLCDELDPRGLAGEGVSVADFFF